MRNFIICNIHCLLLGSLNLRECSKDSAWKKQECMYNFCHTTRGIWGDPQIDNTGK
jgi:hypothetical protein